MNVPVPSGAPVGISHEQAARFAGLPVTLAPLDAVVREATGLSLQPTSGKHVPAAGIQAFSDSAGNSVMVNGVRTPAGVGGALVAAFMQRSFPKENQVAGLGEAAWYRDGSLLVKRGDETLVVRVELAGKSTEDELLAARKIAQAALTGTPPGPAVVESALEA